MKHILATCFAIAVSFTAQAQNITTIAGNGAAGYTGDGSAANSCELNNPFGIAVAKTGEVYIADRHNNCVRRIGTDGIITTIAGTGVAGYSGDGGVATAAMLNSPIGLSIDEYGDVIIADQGNNRIRGVDVFGNIYTLAGNGTSGFSGDGGPATAAQLSNPRAAYIAPTSGDMYIADQANNRVRKVSGHIISTFAGSSTSGFSGDGGPATAAMLNGPYNVLYKNGTVYISDVDNERIRTVVNDTISTIAGNGTAAYSGDGGPATAASLQEPIGFDVDVNGVLYIADAWNGRIRQVTTSGIISTIAGNGTLGYSGDGGLANLAQLNDPYGVAVDNAGNLYISDYTNNRVRFVTHTTAVPQVQGASIALSVFPNPNNGNYTVRVTGNSGEAVYIIMTSLTGQTVKVTNGTTNKDIAICAAAPDGLYLLSATTASGSWYQKIVVSH